MPDLGSCCRGTQPRIFFTICCLFSLIIVVITIFFFYYPDGTPGVYNFEQQPRRPGLREFHGKMSSINRDMAVDTEEDNDVMMVVDSELEYQAKIADYDEEAVPRGSGVSTKLRHHAHHHGKPLVSLEELVQRPYLSNVIENRLLHLDLKGAPPKVSYLKEVMRIAKKAGINGLLIEWEDTFPWTNSLANLTLVEGGYSREEVEELINFAELVLDFEVIPLVQTFGHVEFVLKGQEFRHLREVDGDPQSLCPSKPETLGLIRNMIDQIIEVHQHARFIHIGCDEVFNIRVCPLCTAASEYKEDLFLKHVTEVASYVRLRGRIPIIWDDMLRLVSLRRLNESGIGNLVEPMVWVYAEEVDRFVGWEAWDKYYQIFNTVWGAAAFKGAFGETLSIPPLARHADNVDRWISVIKRESPKWNRGVGGIVLTGWMRYDHFSVLCELLPATIPSLVYNSLLLSIPGSLTPCIKNRIFVPISEDLEDMTTIPPSQSEYDASLSSETSVSVETDHNRSPPTLPSHISKRSPNYKQKISHPRILMTKERLAKAALHSGSLSSELTAAEIYNKSDHVSREFCQILHCPNYHTKLDVLLKGSDAELNFASRCNFLGVAFFRSLFRLRSILHESWELVSKIQRKRGWVTPYNIRHNYSLPLRVDEVVFSEVPRLRRQLEVIVKGIEISLKPIFRQEIILEWIEQNVWEAWKALKNLENAGETLKTVNVWPRRPLQSPWEMIQDFKLSNVEMEQEEL